MSPRGERPAALARVPALAGEDPLPAGVGAAPGPGPALDEFALDQVVESGEIEFVHDLSTVVPARVTLEWLGYPEDEWQWFADTFHGISAYPAGSPEHHEASKAYKPVLARIEEELHDRIVSPRDDTLTAIAHHEVDGERLSEDARSRSRSSRPSAASTPPPRSPAARCCTSRPSRPTASG